MRYIFTLIIVVTLFAACQKQVAPPKIAPWDKLNPGEDYVATFTLEAGKSKEIEIDSRDPVFVGFKTDASKRTALKYSNTFPQPVLLRVVGVDSFVGSIAGAGAVFPPVNDKVRFVSENGSDVSLKIVIFKRKP